MQFKGTVTRNRVHLQFTRIVKVPHAIGNPDLPVGHPSRGFWSERTEYPETVPCATCGKSHAQIHIAPRVPVGMFGCWVVFRYNGEEHVPDLSVPIGVEKLPRDAKPVDAAENARIWHS